MLISMNISNIILENVKKIMAGPQNRRFASATCTTVSNTLRWSKYLQQHTENIILKLKKCTTKTTKCAFLVENFKFGITSFRKVVRNGTILVTKLPNLPRQYRKP